MRVNSEDRQFIKTKLKALVLIGSKINQSELAKIYTISRPTIKKWIQEVRTEQIREIEANTLSEELRLLEEKSKRYAFVLNQILTDYNHIWPDNVPSLLNLIKLQWSIEKDVFILKLGLFSKKLSEEQIYKVNVVNNNLALNNKFGQIIRGD
jgi:hypothetical protein